MTLLELIMALALSAILALGLVQIASAAAASTQLQRNQAQLQEQARLATSLVSRYVREAGFDPEPWDSTRQSTGLASDSADSIFEANDRLAVRSWSDLNCFDNRNPALGPDGRPAFFIREAVFDLNSSSGLTWECRYGPALTDMVTQIRRQGLVQNVESFQVLYGEDSDQDRMIDRWVRAGHWASLDQVLGIRVGLLLASAEPVAEKENQRFQVLDHTVTKQADGRLRRVFQFTTAIRNKAG